MPELPEVEVSRLGLLPLVGRLLVSFTARRADLRQPIPAGLDMRLCGSELAEIRRRGKYLLFHWPAAKGWLILHLGMSGSLRLALPPFPEPGRHDHVDFVFPGMLLRFRDPRRFGLIAWQAGDDPLAHPLLAKLGMEPLSPEFTPEWLIRLVAGRKTPIKSIIMDARFLVGVGNIYAAESLYQAGISPFREAGKIGEDKLAALADAIVATLRESIAAGGSSLRDYVHSDGGAGSFQLQCAVYGREGLPCLRCGTEICRAPLAGRASFYCPDCQS
ncbi:MAG: bifunctional DNA-formamidopyrimidine glycosylase/DNA-(apurinic or apyrimidinic site) lyase [Betaproteobacteria bacterium]|nr:bifunctional DNA-formamidopyrimidine glycosylase/DNA-(apurinic or apyrimidinic site) lyase [Betaproteobacteria bacterium]